MNQMIDLCGTPIQLEQIRSFRLVKRECLYYPAYQETESQIASIFARFGAGKKKKFTFTQMVPFGILLSDKEKPCTGSYEIKSFGEAVTFNLLDGVSKAVGDVASLAADMLRIDTSGNKTFHILTQGRQVTTLRLRDIPAKVQFLSGKVSDVYKNDPIYDFLGEPISPTVVAVPTLLITIDKTPLVFFGGGIDLEDAEAVYHALFETYNQYQATLTKKKPSFALTKMSLNMPKLNMPSIKLQSPFVLHKADKAASPKDNTPSDAPKDGV